MKTEEKRVLWIDGLKGLFAVSVVLCHLACVFVPGLCDINKSSNWFEKIWVSTFFNAITNGNTAVQFFFFATGFLVTRGVYKKCDINTEHPQPYKKYFSLLRLIIPAVTFSFILMKLGALFHQQAIGLDSNLMFANGYNNFIPTIQTYLYEIFIIPFFRNSKFVAPLWTIRYEFWGTILVTFVAYYVRKNNQNGLVMYGLTIIPLAMINGNFVAVMLGAMVYDVYRNQDVGTDVISIVVRFIDKYTGIKILLFIIGFYLACCNLQGVGIYGWLSGISWLPIIRAMGIAVFVFAIMLLPSIQRVLSKKWMIKLGGISAYIYIFHWPIILSLGCGMFVMLYDKISYYLLASIIALISLGATLVLSILYLKILNIIANIVKKIKIKN